MRVIFVKPGSKSLLTDRRRPKIVKTYLNVVICLSRPASAADTPCSCCKNQKSHNHPSFIFSHFSFLHNFVFYSFCISESHMDRVHDVV